MQILKEYYLSIDKRVSIITGALEKSDIKRYTIEVHSLKSMSRQIGADALSELAARLEKAGNELDIDLILSKTSDLIAQYLRYKDILAPLFPELNCNIKPSAADYSVVSMLLDNMAEALDTMDTLLIDDVLEKMSEYSFTSAQSQCFEKLKSSAEDCDIDLCTTIIGIWRQIAESESRNNITDTTEIRNALDNMKNALNKFDTLLIDDVIEQMDKMHLSDNQAELFIKLKEAAENCNMELCGNIVADWENIL